jgi:hypothetical protein
VLCVKLSMICTHEESSGRVHKKPTTLPRFAVCGVPSPLVRRDQALVLINRAAARH